jgi:hypothetical protein
MAPSICGDSITSKRSLLALGWSVVNTLALISFLTAFLFALSAKNINNQNQQYYNQGDEQEEEDEEIVIAVTSRAMAFAALWTAVIAGILGSFGTMLLGVVMPNGKYYWCCAGRVHRTTPLVLGAFVGALLMFANLTLVCSVLFGEFEVRFRITDFEKDCSSEPPPMIQPFSRFVIIKKEKKKVEKRLKKCLRRLCHEHHSPFP